jgi:hypothetical protein
MSEMEKYKEAVILALKTLPSCVKNIVQMLKHSVTFWL